MEKGLGHLFMTSSNFHFLNKNNFEQSRFEIVAKNSEAAFNRKSMFWQLTTTNIKLSIDTVKWYSSKADLETFTGKGSVQDLFLQTFLYDFPF